MIWVPVHPHLDVAKVLEVKEDDNEEEGENGHADKGGAAEDN